MDGAVNKLDEIEFTELTEVDEATREVPATGRPSDVVGNGSDEPDRGPAVVGVEDLGVGVGRVSLPDDTSDCLNCSLLSRFA